jgi:hypothetical protein
MFSTYVKSLLCSCLVLVTAACGTGNQENQGSHVKSIADKNDRVFGLRQTSGDSSGENATFEFRLCRTNETKIISQAALDNSDTCINPFQTSEGAPLVLSSKIFADADAAQSYLSRLGYAKGAMASLAAVGGTVVLLGQMPAVVLQTLIPITARVFSPLFVAVFSSGGMGTGGWILAGALDVTAISSAAGVGGFTIFGAKDRELSRDIQPIVGDFYSAKTVRDVKPLLVKFAKTLNFRVDSRVSEY